jgi:hypothetical protein
MNVLDRHLWSAIATQRLADLFQPHHLDPAAVHSSNNYQQSISNIGKLNRTNSRGGNVASYASSVSSSSAVSSTFSSSSNPLISSAPSTAPGSPVHHSSVNGLKLSSAVLVPRPSAAAEAFVKAKPYFLDQLRPEDSREIASLQAGLHPDFLPLFNNAVRLYVNGQWPIAKTLLEACILSQITSVYESIVFVTSILLAYIISGMSRARSRRWPFNETIRLYGRTSIPGSLQLARLSSSFYS